MKDRVKPIAIQEFDTSTLHAVNWAAFDLTGIDGACSSIRITNDSGTVVYVRYDAHTADAHDVLLANTSVQYDLQANSRSTNHVALLAKGTVVWLRGTPGVGTAYLSGWYQEV